MLNLVLGQQHGVAHEYEPPHAEQQDVSRTKESIIRRRCDISFTGPWILLPCSVVLAIVIIYAFAHQNAKNDKHTPSELLPDTQLSSVSFTDEHGYDNYLLFYQLRSGDICQSVWNSSVGRWKVILASGNGDAIKDHTPISTTMFKHSEKVSFRLVVLFSFKKLVTNTTSQERDIHLFYLNKSSNILGQLTKWRTWADDLDDWEMIPKIAEFQAPSSTSIASNGRECFGCYTENFIIFQGYDNKVVVLKKAHDSDEHFLSSTPENWGHPIPGSGLALVSAQRTDREGNLYLFSQASGTGKLRCFTYSQGEWIKDDTLQTWLGGPATLAAFSTGYYDSDASDFTMEVLALLPGKEVLITEFKDGKWWYGKRIESMLGDKLPRTITANQGGRVYGTINTGDGRFEVMEWMWWGDNGSFLEVGLVNTTLPESDQFQIDL